MKVSYLLTGTVLVLTLGCASGTTTQRYVDEPVGVSHQFGTPQNTTYSAEVEAEKDILRLTVFKQSECERIRVRIVSRTEETLQDGEVVERQPVGPVQVADGSDGLVNCAQGFARDVRVNLKVGTSNHLLGRTNPTGELNVNLSSELKESLYGERAPATATLMVEGQEVSRVSLTELRKHEDHVSALLGEFEALLQKDPTEWTPAEIARSYVLFEQLRALDRGDARIAALTARFLELNYGRKSVEATANLKRNLEALKSAKELLGGKSGVPMFVQIAVQDGSTAPNVIRWARGQVLVGLRGHSQFCAGKITWQRIGQQSWGTEMRLALAYLHYALDDPFLSDVSSLCKGLR